MPGPKFITLPPRVIAPPNASGFSNSRLPPLRVIEPPRLIFPRLTAYTAAVSAKPTVPNANPTALLGRSQMNPAMRVSPPQNPPPWSVPLEAAGEPPWDECRAAYFVLMGFTAQPRFNVMFG